MKQGGTQISRSTLQYALIPKTLTIIMVYSLRTNNSTLALRLKKWHDDAFAADWTINNTAFSAWGEIWSQDFEATSTDMNRITISRAGFWLDNAPAMHELHVILRPTRQVPCDKIAFAWKRACSNYFLSFHWFLLSQGTKISRTTISAKIESVQSYISAAHAFVTNVEIRIAGSAGRSQLTEQ